jgi:glutathione-regulated potassium-efflux system ancillary protein KefG
MHAVTTGGRESAYGTQGLNRYSMRQFLRPLEQTAHLCGMHFLPPFIVHGTHQLTPAAIAKHAVDYRQVIKALRDGRIDYEAVCEYPRINAALGETLNLTEGEQHAR